MMTFEQEENLQTCRLMLASLALSLLMVLPLFVFTFDKDWPWAQGFPLGWLGACLEAMGVFFHELGHAIAFWFYGYIALPHFDLYHGGGLTTPLSGQIFILNLALYGALIYGYLHLKDYRFWQWLCVGIAVFHLATAYTQAHMVIVLFAGVFAQIIIAAFLLIRALFDLAPRGIVERFLNAVFGFSMAFSVLISNWSLIHNALSRHVYYNQKGGHGFGDLDRIHDITDVDFSIIAWSTVILSMTAVILPFLLYIYRPQLFRQSALQ